MLSIVLAAGKGTRMRSDLTKVLHPLAGKPMVGHVIDTLKEIKDNKIICVVGHQADEVRQTLDTGLVFVEQKKQLGTGHAVIQAREYLARYEGPVLIVCGDTPLLRKETLRKLLSRHRKENSDLSILTAILEEPGSYGRIVLDDEKKNIKRIVEITDASPKEREIKEVNSGLYCFRGKLLNQALDSLDRDNAQGEYYLTDVVDYLAGQGKKICPVRINDPAEIKGVNTRKDLAEAENEIRQRINNSHMLNGVTIIDPTSTFIDKEVEIGRDTIIYPFTYIEGNVSIGSHCKIGPQSRIVDSCLGEEVCLKSGCIIRESVIGSQCTIGPYAYVRPGCRIEENVKLGDFVELKKARVETGAKVPHLSYVGDAEIGNGTNIGAGTIFANYDGKEKHKTVIGKSVFIGSNTTLIAPVKVGDRAKTGAGSVVTRDVLRDTTVLGVPARVYKRRADENNV
ncbi:MAG: bifunctional UDP-N-acetylglucosamine diphosphorylase/glucosamine-1-phosphate N-acetyltransferase GlmU [Halanaerobiaceae bacterium]